jgi:hypothetical protein
MTTTASTTQPGTQITTHLTDTSGVNVTATVAIRRVDRLGCGCDRLTAGRPGNGPGPQHVQLLTGCHRHDSDIL